MPLKNFLCELLTKSGEEMYWLSGTEKSKFVRENYFRI